MEGSWYSRKPLVVVLWFFKKTIYGVYMVNRKRKLQEKGTKKVTGRTLYENSIRLAAEISNVQNHELKQLRIFNQFVT